jgi:hypothetical protein
MDVARGARLTSNESSRGLGSRRESVLFNTPLPVAYAVFACDLHSELQSNKTLQNNALTLLVNELTH